MTGVQTCALPIWHVGVDTPLGLLALPFQKQGRLDLPTVPQVSLGTPSLGDLSLTSATLRLPLTIANDNPFALPLGAIAGTLKVAGANIGSIESKDVGMLSAKGKQVIELPVKIRYSDALDAVRALRSGAARIDLKGELRSGGAALPFHLEKDVDLSSGGSGGGDSQ